MNMKTREQTMDYIQTSQYGECMLLKEHYKNKTGFFIDLGAADGKRYSNTFNLINSGWSGILVEPCQHFLEDLHKLNENNNLICIFSGAVSNYNGSTDFYVWKEGGDSQISTIEKNQYETLKNSDYWHRDELVKNPNFIKHGGNNFTQQYKVDVITPTELLTRFNAPKHIDFVDIDVEGSEMKILDAWPWEDYTIDLFCIEFSMGKENIIKYMAERKYVPWFDTGGNLLFCRKEKWDEFFKTSKLIYESGRANTREGQV